MGRLSRFKEERRGTFYRKFLKDLREERGFHTFEINGHSTILNPAKHILKGIRYRNEECQNLLKKTLEQYKAYIAQMSEESFKEKLT